MAESELAACSLRIGSRRIANLGKDAARLDREDHLDDALAIGRRERQTLDRVVDNEIDVAAHAFEQIA